ncbi:MAG: MarR family winged helix-turn-helix transcriptional regulator [Pseudomonadota bacterium]
MNTVASSTPLPDSLFLVPAPEGEETLDFDASPSVLLTFVANKFTRKSSAAYDAKYGIGAMDWRMLVMLTRAPGCSAAQASVTIGIDKAAVSRSLQRLEASGHAQATERERDPRRKAWRLTDAGRALHGRILEDALAAQSALLQGLSEDEVRALAGILRRLNANLEADWAGGADPETSAP